MRTRIDYLADKYCFTVSASDIRRSNIVALTECRQTEAGPEEHLRIALLNVDCVARAELFFGG